MECSLMPASAAFEFHGRRLGGYQLYTARCTGSSTESRAEITQRAISYRMDCATGLFVALFDGKVLRVTEASGLVLRCNWNVT